MPKFYNHIAKTIHALHQSHLIEVTQEDIFMEQKRRFGLVLGQVAILKKMGRLRPIFDGIFLMFSWTKKV